MADAANSSSGTVAEAVDHIATLDSEAAVSAYVEGDDRQGVRKAADERIAELSQPGVVASDDPRSAPGSPLRSGGGAKRVRTSFPIDRFEHGIEGVEAITATGVEVAAGHIDELLDRAADASIALEEVDG